MPSPDENLKVSVIIASWNAAALLAACLSALPAAFGEMPWEALVVDNASSDGSAAIAGAVAGVQVIRNTENRGYAAANNQGIRASSGNLVLLLNNDTLPRPGALASLARFVAGQPKVGAAGPRLLRPDGSAQPFAFGRDPRPGYLLARGLARLAGRHLHDWSTGRAADVDWVSGACLLARREAVDAAGPLDERFFMYFEDNDWCLRIRRAGWRVCFVPSAEVMHIGGASAAGNPAARAAYHESLAYFYRKHYGRLAEAALLCALAPYRLLARR